jgi:hypothetical protein
MAGFIDVPRLNFRRFFHTLGRRGPRAMAAKGLLRIPIGKIAELKPLYGARLSLKRSGSGLALPLRNVSERHLRVCDQSASGGCMKGRGGGPPYIKAGAIRRGGKHAFFGMRGGLRFKLDACKKHKAKLVIAKLDRLSRNLAFIATLNGQRRRVRGGR